MDQSKVSVEQNQSASNCLIYGSICQDSEFLRPAPSPSRALFFLLAGAAAFAVLLKAFSIMAIDFHMFFILNVRYCFFEASESKKLNCVSVWPATPYFEALTNRNQYSS